MWPIREYLLSITPGDLLNWFFSLLIMFFVLLSLLLLPALMRGL